MLKGIIASKFKSLKKYINKEIHQCETKIIQNDIEMKQIAEEIASSVRTVDRFLTENMQEYLDEQKEYKYSMDILEKDREMISNVYDRDIKRKQQFYRRQLKETYDSNKRVLKHVISKIYQGEKEMRVDIRLNSFLPFELNSELLLTVIQDRNNLANQYSYKDVDVAQIFARKYQEI